jgi:hypothetical protein
MGTKGKVIMFAAVSLDGYVANERDEVGPRSTGTADSEAHLEAEGNPTPESA